MLECAYAIAQKSHHCERAEYLSVYFASIHNVNLTSSHITTKVIESCLLFY